MRIALGADHAGLELKQTLIHFASGLGHEVNDLGTHSGESVDYPDFARVVAESVASARADCGILVCGTGLGMAIAANRVKGVRAVTCGDTYSAQMSRAHNDANVLALGARVIGGGLAEEIVRSFLETRFQGGRHAARLQKVEDMWEENPR